MIVRTMQSVFPEYHGLIVLSGSDTVLLASDSPP